jgi:hypothetical protein
MNKKVIALIVAGVVGLGAIWYLNSTAQVYAVNPLPLAVTVTVDGKAFPLEPGARAELGRLSTGEHSLSATRTADGKQLEQLTINTSSSGTNVYAVFGAAPLSLDAIFYATDRANAPEPRRTSQCGKPAFQVHHADYAFEEPPSSIEMPSGSSVTQKTVLRLHNGGYAGCIMAPSPDPLAMAELTLKVTGALDKPDEQRQLTWWAVELLGRAGQKQRALELVEPIASDPKASIDDHRAFQDLMRSLGRRTDLEARYKARYAADATAQNAYLSARVLDAKASLAVAEAALVKWPDDVYLHRSRMWNLDLLGDATNALAEAEWMLKLPKKDDDTSMRDFVRTLKVRSLVSLGRAAEAVDFLKSELEPTKEWSFADAILVERTARAARLRPWVAPFSRIARKAGTGSTGEEEAMFRYFYDLSLGGTTPSKPAVLNGTGFAAFDVLDAAQANPAQAITKLAALDASQDVYMSPEQAWVLLVEAWRVGNEAAAKRVAGYVQGAGDTDAAREFINGSEYDEGALRDAQPEARAALLLGRARTLESRGDHEGADAMLAQLRRADPLEGLAVRAATAWAVKAAAPAPQAHTRIREAGKVKVE